MAVRVTVPSLQEQIDQDLRRLDEPLWLSSRFIADPLARSAIVALYVFDLTLEQTALRTRDPMLGEIRLGWWREQLDSLIMAAHAETTTSPAHPVLEALAAPLKSGQISGKSLQTLLDVHERATACGPFPDEEAMDHYLKTRFGTVIKTAIAGLTHKPGFAGRPTYPVPAGLAETIGSLSGLVRILRSVLPKGAKAMTRTVEHLLPLSWQTWPVEDIKARLDVKVKACFDALPRDLQNNFEIFPILIPAGLAKHPRAGPLMQRVWLMFSMLRGDL